MINLVTLDEAKEHLRVDHDADDSDIKLKIAGVSAIIIDYIKDGVKKIIDENGQPIESMELNRVKIAVLLLLGILYKDRDSEFMNQWQLGFLPDSVTALIYSLRTPTVA